MNFVLPLIEFVGAIAMLFLFSGRNPWATLSLKLAGFALLSHIVLSHFYGQITIHRIYFAYYAGMTAGIVLGIFFVLLVARQLGKKEPPLPAAPILN